MKNIKINIKKSKIERLFSSFSRVESVSVASDGNNFKTAVVLMSDYEAAKKAKKIIRKDFSFNKYGADAWRIKVYALEEERKHKKRDRKSEEKEDKDASTKRNEEEVNLLKNVPLIPYSFRLLPRIKSIDPLVKPIDSETIRRLPWSEGIEFTNLFNARELVVKLPQVEVSEADIYNQSFAYGDVEKIEIINWDEAKCLGAEKDSKKCPQQKYALIRFYLIHWAKKMFINKSNIRILGHQVEVDFNSDLSRYEIFFDKPTYFLSDSTCHTLSTIYLGDYYPSIEESKLFFEKFGKLKAFSEYKTIHDNKTKIVHFVEYEKEQGEGNELRGIKRAFFDIQGSKRPAFVVDFLNLYQCIVNLAVEERNKLTIIHKYKQVKSGPVKKVEKKVLAPSTSFVPIRRVNSYGYTDYNFFCSAPIFGNNSKSFKKAKNHKYINPKLLEKRKSEDDAENSKHKELVESIDKKLFCNEQTEVGDEDKQSNEFKHEERRNQTNQSWVSDPLSENENSK